MSKTASLVMSKTASLSPPCDVENSIKGNGKSDVENTIKSSLTTWVARAGSGLEAETSQSGAAGDAAVEPPANAPIGHNARPPLEDDLSIPAFLRRTSLH